MEDVKPLKVSVFLDHIHCYDEGDSAGNAEPFIWVVFFKIDGETAFVDNSLKLQGTATVQGRRGNHGNLRNNVNLVKMYKSLRILES